MHNIIKTIGLFSVAIMPMIPATETYIAIDDEPLSVESIVTVDDAKEFLLENYPDLYDVAQCESSWQRDAKNPKSTASGILQFLDGTANWVYESIYGKELNPEMKNDPRLQVEMALWLYERYHLDHWECHTKNLV